MAAFILFADNILKLDRIIRFIAIEDSDIELRYIIKCEYVGDDGEFYTINLFEKFKDRKEFNDRFLQLVNILCVQSSTIGMYAAI